MHSQHVRLHSQHVRLYSQHVRSHSQHVRLHSQLVRLNSQHVRLHSQHVRLNSQPMPIQKILHLINTLAILANLLPKTQKHPFNPSKANGQMKINKVKSEILKDRKPQ